MRAIFNRKLLALMVAIPLAALLAWSLLWNYMQTPVRGLTDGFEFEVVQGASLKTVARDLADGRLLEWPQLFVLWGRLNGGAGRIQAGVYLIEPGLTLSGLLALMESGKVSLYPITIVEGWTIPELFAALAANPVIAKTLDQGSLDLNSILAADAAASGHPEGWFFPETYMVPRNTTDSTVLLQASKLMHEKLTAIWNSREPGLPLTSPYELLILASIIERETALSSERAKIAGVFIRRLRLGMRLQTDPSVIYGVGPDFEGGLTRTHLATDTPYNTYTRSGLPPTPIGLPGEESLYAAAHPEAGNELFFVASGKGDGSHVFSATLDQHNAAVAKYRAIQRKAAVTAKPESKVTKRDGKQ